MASKYLAPCEDTKVAQIEGNNVKAIPNATVKSVVSELGITSYEVVSADGNKKAEGDKVGTGYKLKDKNNNKEYTLVVMGDVNGDAEINSGDLLFTKKHLLGTSTVTGVQKTAMDINKDNEVNSGDLLLLKKFLLGTSEISL